MEKKMVYWATFYSPDIMFANTWDKYFDKEPKPEEVVFPKNAYAFQLYKREDVVDAGKTYQGKSEEIGKLCYHKDSTITTLAELKKENDPLDQTLISNMKGNKWNKVIWTRWKTWPQPYDEKQVCILKG